MLVAMISALVLPASAPRLRLVLLDMLAVLAPASSARVLLEHSVPYLHALLQDTSPGGTGRGGRAASMP